MIMVSINGCTVSVLIIIAYESIATRSYLYTTWSLDLSPD